ncbi:hypothetical protein [Paenibacillus glycanilyticus]|uniref:Lipoprotein n=1 Tax=Paenibacillus glycanilyticus TaxID=126569 RepID=A0ABQ6GPS3_9BACL|nr:hypothetical protein [Paenibacillus glycanilyticus]GLX71351.1 hypothetical protein MU1_57010 [Paenibacillus glycanilyticus]
MKQWRVGSLSMGITLLLIGIAIGLSIWIGTESLELLLWVAPAVFILLGIEMLVHLKLSKEEKPILRYDWMSMFYVAVIGAGSLLMAGFTSTGLLGEVRDQLQMTERTAIVQSEPVSVPDGIKKIVVQSLRPVQLDQGESRAVQLLGQVQYWSPKPLKQPEQMVATSTVGSTMYVLINGFEHKDGSIGSESINQELTLVLPQEIEIEKRGF